MPDRFDERIAQMKDPKLSPSERLALLADVVIEMADTLKKVADEVKRERSEH